MKNLIIAITLVLMSCGHASTKSSGHGVKLHLAEKGGLSLTDNGVQGVAFSRLSTIAYSHNAGVSGSVCSDPLLPATWSCASIKWAIQPIVETGSTVDLLSLPDVFARTVPILNNGFSVDFLVTTIYNPAVIANNVMYGGGWNACADKSVPSRTTCANGQQTETHTPLDGIDKWKSVKNVHTQPTWPVVSIQTPQAQVVFVRNDWIAESVTIRMKEHCASVTDSTPCVKDASGKEIGFTSRSLSNTEQEYVDMFVSDILNTEVSGAVFFFVPVSTITIQNNEILDIKLLVDFSNISITPATTVTESTCNTTFDQEKAKYVAQQQALLDDLATWNSIPSGMQTNPAPVMPSLPAEWQTSAGWVCPTGYVKVNQKTVDTMISLGTSLPFNMNAVYATTPAAK